VCQQHTPDGKGVVERRGGEQGELPGCDWLPQLLHPGSGSVCVRAISKAGRRCLKKQRPRCGLARGTDHLPEKGSEPLPHRGVVTSPPSRPPATGPKRDRDVNQPRPLVSRRSHRRHCVRARFGRMILRVVHPWFPGSASEEEETQDRVLWRLTCVLTASGRQH